MSTTFIPTPEALHEPEPAWEIARLFPAQGQWREDEYLDLTDSTNNFVEFNRGVIEVLPMPTLRRQLILDYLMDELKSHIKPNKLGLAVFSPLRVKVAEDIIREPDIVFVSSDNQHKIANRLFNGADLVMEIVSEDSESHNRDYVAKRADYANAGIAGYWIVDPQAKTIAVLALDGKQYATHCQVNPGEQAVSKLLEGFAVDVKATFDAGEIKRS